MMYSYDLSTKALIETSTYGKITLDPDLNGDGDPDYYVIEANGDEVSDDVSKIKEEGIVPINEYDHIIFVYNNMFWEYGLELPHSWNGFAQSNASLVAVQFSGYYGITLRRTIAHEMGHNMGIQHVKRGGDSYGDQYGYMGATAKPLPFIQRQKLDQTYDLGLFQDHHVETIDLTTPGQYTFDLAPLENNPWDEDRVMAIYIDDLVVSFRFQDEPFLESDYADDKGLLHLYYDNISGLDEYIGTLAKDKLYDTGDVQFWFDESSENGATVHVIVN